MKVDKKESQLQTEKNTLPLPSPSEKNLVQGEIDAKLAAEVRQEVKKQGLKIRDVIEWGFAQWLLNVNPQAAKRVKLINK